MRILGGGFKYFLVWSLFGEDSHLDSYFSNGWFNHQLEYEDSLKKQKTYSMESKGFCYNPPSLWGWHPFPSRKTNQDSMESKGPQVCFFDRGFCGDLWGPDAIRFAPQQLKVG